MEINILKFIQSFANPFLDTFFSLITNIGSEFVLIAILCFIYLSIDKEKGEYIAFTFLLSGFLNFTLKNIFKFERPIGQKGIRTLMKNTAPGYSFPSGHSQFSSTLFNSIFLSFKNRFTLILAVLLPLLIGLSRMYLGVHYPKDILAGLIIGYLISYLMYKVYYSLNKNTIFILIILFSIPASFISKDPDFIKFAGALSGFSLGVIIENKYINFHNSISFIKKIIRYILGLAFIVLMRYIFKMILPATVFFDFLRYMIIFIIFTTVYPLIFKKFNF